MDNLVVNIVLPAGFALMTGEILDKDMTLLVVGSITPWYASIDMVRTEGGIYLGELGDLAVSASIYKNSRQADIFSCRNASVPAAGLPSTDSAVKEYNNFLFSRQTYVAKRSAYQCMLNVYDLAGSRGSKTLGNLSVTRMSFNKGESIPRKLDEIKKEFQEMEIVIKSGGTIGAGGTVKSNFSAKQKYGSDSPPGRLWITTGLGANHKSIPGYGSEGAPVKYSSSPVIGWRYGNYGGGSLITFPKVIF